MSEMAVHAEGGPQGLKPVSSAGVCGTAEAVPLSKTVGAGDDNRRSFDCGRDATFAQDDKLVGGAREGQLQGFFATLRMTSAEGRAEAAAPCSLFPIPSDDQDATPFDKLREECGVMAVYGHPDAARMTYWGLYALQHRGQESAGIACGGWQRCERHQGHGVGERDLYRRCAGQAAGAYCDRAHALFDDRRFGAAECAADFGGVDQGADCDCAQRQPGEPGQLAKRGWSAMARCFRPRRTPRSSCS